jgi:hypothetical protein
VNTFFPLLVQTAPELLQSYPECVLWFFSQPQATTSVKVIDNLLNERTVEDSKDTRDSPPSWKRRKTHLDGFQALQKVINILSSNMRTNAWFYVHFLDAISQNLSNENLCGRRLLNWIVSGASRTALLFGKSSPSDFGISTLVELLKNLPKSNQEQILWVLESAWCDRSPSQSLATFPLSFENIKALLAAYPTMFPELKLLVHKIFQTFLRQQLFLVRETGANLLESVTAILLRSNSSHFPLLMLFLETVMSSDPKITLSFLGNIRREISWQLQWLSSEEISRMVKVENPAANIMANLINLVNQTDPIRSIVNGILATDRAALSSFIVLLKGSDYEIQLKVLELIAKIIQTMTPNEIERFTEISTELPFFETLLDVIEAENFQAELAGEIIAKFLDHFPLMKRLSSMLFDHISKSKSHEEGSIH